MLLLRYLGVGKYINLAFIWENKEALQHFIASNYLLSVFLFLLFFIFVVAFAIPISIILNIAAGYFFGVFEAILYTNIGSTVGSLLAFLTFRYLLRDGLKKKYGNALDRFNEKFKEQGANYLLFLQLLPITPFSLITILAGLSDISVWTFLWTTSVGILPGSAIYAFAGSKLAHVTSVKDILSPSIIIALSLLALLALLPVIIKHVKSFQVHKR